MSNTIYFKRLSRILSLVCLFFMCYISFEHFLLQTPAEQVLSTRYKQKVPTTSDKQETRSYLEQADRGHVSTSLKVNFVPLTPFLSVFGVYLDKRTSQVYIRILVLQKQVNHTVRMVCRLGDTMSAVAQAYEMCENHGKDYGGWIYSCPLANRLTPDNIHIAIYWGDNSSYHTFQLQALQPHRKCGGQDFDNLNTIKKYPTQLNLTAPLLQTQHETSSHQQLSHVTACKQTKIAVCVPPIHGNIPLQKLIHFLELAALLGADQIFLYIDNIPEDLRAFLTHYNSDFLTLVGWDMSFLSQSLYKVLWNHGQLLAIQHCLYSQMTDFDWLMFMDIDEMLVPQTASTWQELVQDILNVHHVNTDQVAAITFHSAFFSQDIQTPQSSSSIPYFQYLYRSKQLSRERSKLLVRSQSALEVGIHHLSQAVSRNLRILPAPTHQVILHHYRTCDPANVQCDQVVKDLTILKYEDQLTQASKQKLNLAMKWFQHT